MSAQCETTARRAGGKEMPFFERYLSIWVALCIVAGIGLGRFLPGLFESLGSIYLQTNHYFAFGHSDIDPGLFQFRFSLLAEQEAGRGTLRGRTLGIDWCQ